MINKLQMCLTILLLFSFSTVQLANEIPFELNGGLVVVKASINNKEGYYILDTGSSDLLLNQPVVKQDASFETSSGTSPAESMVVGNLKIGNVNFYDIDAYKMDLTKVSQFISLPLEGIIGARLLEPYGVVLNFKSNTLKLILSGEDHFYTDNKNIMPFKMINDVPVIEVNINDVFYRFILDSGATTHYVDEGVIESNGNLFLATNDSVNSSTTDIGFQSRIYDAEYLVFGNHKSENIQVVSGKFTHLMSDTEISGLISMYKLSNKQIYIDTKNDVVYFD